VSFPDPRRYTPPVAAEASRVDAPESPVSSRRLPLVVPALYPIAFSLAYVGSLALQLGGSVLTVPRILMITAIVGALLGAGCNLMLRDRDRGALLSFALLSLILFGTSPPAAAVFAVAAIAVVVSRVWEPANVIPWRIVTRVANSASLVVVLVFVITGFQRGGFDRIFEELRPPPASAEPARADLPDIWLIVLDGYERPDKMTEVFGYDDSAFVQGLEQRGFQVAADSRSNYIQTTHSIPSLLNMRHVNDLIEPRRITDPPYRASLNRLVSDGEVIRTLRGLGYSIESISAGFEDVTLRGADKLIDTGPMNEFDVVMMRVTTVGRVISAVAPDFFGDQQRTRILESFGAIGSIARQPQARPRFVFAHIPAPHGPIVFGPNGESIPASPLDRFYDDTPELLGLSRELFGQRYVGEVEFINKHALAAVDAILAAAPKPPIILLLSDHGSGSGFFWNEPSRSDMDERTANLFAAYTPDHRHLFPDDITLVNVFARLFGAYFSLDVPLQPDAFYRWDDANTHLVRVEVNDAH